MYICIYIWKYTYLHTHTYPPLHPHIHTHTNTNKHTPVGPLQHQVWHLCLKSARTHPHKQSNKYTHVNTQTPRNTQTHTPTTTWASFAASCLASLSEIRASRWSTILRKLLISVLSSCSNDLLAPYPSHWYKMNISNVFIYTNINIYIHIYTCRCMYTWLLIYIQICAKMWFLSFHPSQMNC